MKVQEEARPAAGRVAPRIRPVKPDDAAGLRGMFDRLSKESVYRRFHTPYERVPDRFAGHLVDPAAFGGGALVAVAAGEVVGHAMYAPDGVSCAEVAVVVEDAWQGQGVGKRLLARLAEAAADQGVGTFMCSTLGDNRRVLGLARSVLSGVRSTAGNGRCEIRASLGSLVPGGSEREGRR
jgi:GNAT superfamily N-acetyltransferase